MHIGGRHASIYIFIHHTINVYSFSVQRLSQLVCTKHRRVKFKSTLIFFSKVEGNLGNVAIMRGINVMGNANDCSFNELSIFIDSYALGAFFYKCNIAHLKPYKYSMAGCYLFPVDCDTAC